MTVLSKTCFISDLHLDVREPNNLQACLDLLSDYQADQTLDALYILGDLFEYWLGDDMLDQAMAQPFLPIIAALSALSQRGVALFVMHGNRDFLFADEFAASTGCQLLPDEQVIDLYGQRTLLMHGDTLCTDDVAYLQLRQMLRNPAWQADFLQKPFAARLQMALDLRAESQQQTAQKSAEIMDVNPQAVLARMQAHNVNVLIHGHTHRMYHHYFTDHGKTLQRIVLSDWHGEAHALEVYSNGEQHLY